MSKNWKDYTDKDREAHRLAMSHLYGSKDTRLTADDSLETGEQDDTGKKDGCEPEKDSGNPA